jgi:hypothetical protein
MPSHLRPRTISSSRRISIPSSATHPLHPGHSHHIPRRSPRTRNLASSGLGLSTRVALSGALDGLVNDLDGGLGLPVRVELQVVAFGSNVSAPEFVFHDDVSAFAASSSVARRARVAAHWRSVVHTQELVKVL